MDPALVAAIGGTLRSGAIARVLRVSRCARSPGGPLAPERRVEGEPWMRR